LRNSDTRTTTWNIKKRGTKVPLNIFYIELIPKNNNKDIYEATHELDYTVKFEPPHPKRKIPQCINCQQYDHTKCFCNRKARCVMCAEDHPIFNCPRKVNSENVKCMLCEANHPVIIKHDLQSCTRNTSPHYGRRK